MNEPSKSFIEIMFILDDLGICKEPKQVGWIPGKKPKNTK